MGCVFLMGSTVCPRTVDMRFAPVSRLKVPHVVHRRRKTQRLRPTKRPVTVADSIQMTRLGDPIYTDGDSPKGS